MSPNPKLLATKTRNLLAWTSPISTRYRVGVFITPFQTLIVAVSEILDRWFLLLLDIISISRVTWRTPLIRNSKETWSYTKKEHWFLHAQLKMTSFTTTGRAQIQNIFPSRVRFCGAVSPVQLIKSSKETCPYYTATGHVRSMSSRGSCLNSSRNSVRGWPLLGAQL